MDEEDRTFAAGAADALAEGRATLSPDGTITMKSSTSLLESVPRAAAYITTEGTEHLVDLGGLAADLVILAKISGLDEANFLRRVTQTWEDVNVEVVPRLN